jgi:hypothetical protein
LFPFALKEQCEVVRTTVKFQKKSKTKIKLKQNKQQNKTKTNKQKREKHEVEVRLSLNRSPELSIHYFHKQDFSFYDMTANRLHGFFSTGTRVNEYL